jgi:hypothetical protein
MKGARRLLCTGLRAGLPQKASAPMKRLSTLVTPSIVAVSFVVAFAGLTILAEMGESHSGFVSDTPGAGDSPRATTARADVGLAGAAGLSNIDLQSRLDDGGQFALGRTINRGRPAGRAEREDETLMRDRADRPGDDATVRAAQQALQLEGLDVGEIDGVVGPRTESALREFQEMHGLTRSGVLDRETRAALDVEAAASVGSAGGDRR